MANHFQTMVNDSLTVFFGHVFFNVPRSPVAGLRCVPDASEEFKETWGPSLSQDSYIARATMTIDFMMAI